MRMQVYLNGEYLEREHAAISVEDRGFLFGDGVYEVVRAAGGRLIEAQRHWRRLARSLNGIMIERPAELDDDALSTIAYRLLDLNDLTEGDALLYLQVTRGAAVRTHHFPAATTRPTVFASASAFQPPDALRARGAAVITMPVVEVDGRPVASGRPGPVTQRLYAALRERLLANALEPVAE